MAFPDYFSEITYYPADQFSDERNSFWQTVQYKGSVPRKIKRTVSGQRVSGWISNMSLNGVCFLFCVECSTKNGWNYSPGQCGAKYGTRKKYDKKLDKTRYQCIIQNANELQMHAGCKNE